MTLAAVGLGLVAALLTGCKTADVQSAAYSTELGACTEQAATLCESITCENAVRARYSRPPRALPDTCKDGGK